MAEAELARESRAGLWVLCEVSPTVVGKAQRGGWRTERGTACCWEMELPGKGQEVKVRPTAVAAGSPGREGVGDAVTAAGGAQGCGCAASR